MSAVLVEMVPVDITSLNVTAIVVSGELLVELIVGLTEDIVGAVVSVPPSVSVVSVPPPVSVVLAPNFS